MPFLGLISLLLISNTYAIPYKEIDAFVEVYETIKNMYIEEIDERTLIDHAISGMVSKLDPHSAYLISNESEPSFLQNDFTGIGIEFSHDGENLEIMSVLSESPAYDNHLKAHDKILMINNTWAKGLSLEEAASMMKGPVGTSVKLVVLRKNAQKPETIALTREWLEEKTVTYKKIDQIGYMRINRFIHGTAQEVFTALNPVMLQEIDGLILDLRNNPGGLVQSATTIANFFLEKDFCAKNYPSFENKIVYSKGREVSFNIAHYIEGCDTTKNLPIVILINHGSASASEILAGALQDYGRAIIIGERSFGKGSVQTVLPIQNNLLKMTCARYYTPQGRSIQASGIQPDITVYGEWVKPKEDSLMIISEKSLPKHLKGNESFNTIATLSEWDAIDDPFLVQARGILSALKIEKTKYDPLKDIHHRKYQDENS